MKRFVFFLFCSILGVVKLNATEPIIYALNDSIEMTVGNYLELYASDDLDKIGFYIFRDKDEDYRIKMALIPNAQILMKNYFHRGNRFILIGRKTYPLMFDYDLKYATGTPIEKLGDYGNREGTVSRTFFILEPWYKRFEL